jgi:hypothetical protein
VTRRALPFVSASTQYRLRRPQLCIEQSASAHPSDAEFRLDSGFFAAFASNRVGAFRLKSLITLTTQEP